MVQSNPDATITMTPKLSFDFSSSLSSIPSVPSFVPFCKLKSRREHVGVAASRVAIVLMFEEA